MNLPEIKAFIEEYSYLFWYTPDKEKVNISNELLVETILNYGNMDSIKKLFGVMRVKNAANVFFGMKGRKKHNIYPEIYNLFSLYFKRYA
jgi:hypothetical protein